MSDEDTQEFDRVTDLSIDLQQPAISVGTSVADSLLPMITDVSAAVDPRDRADYWHGLLAAISATMSAHVGLVQGESILKVCITYGRQMAAEESEARKGAH